MEEQNGGDRDESSIKPVSSLRSHFESMINARPASGQATQISATPRLPSGQQKFEPVTDRFRSEGRPSLDIPRSAPKRSSSSHQLESEPFHTLATGKDGLLSDKPKLRPISMGPLSPPRSPRASPPRSPPLVTIDSPSSPPRQTYDAHQTTYNIGRRSQEELRKVNTPRSSSPTGAPRNFKIPSRSTTPALDTQNLPSLSSNSAHTSTTDPRKEIQVRPSSGNMPIPPPINRAGKPKIFLNKTVPITPDRTGSKTLAPDVMGDKDEERVSPFSTPPSEPESPSGIERSTPPPIPEHSKPRSGQQNSGKEHFSSLPFQTTNSGRSQIHSSRHPYPIKLDTKKQMILPPPVDYTDSPEERPNLPPRREQGSIRIRSRSPRVPLPELPVRGSIESPSTSTTYRSSMESRPRKSLDSMSSASTMVTEANHKFQPPPKRIPATTRKIHPHPHDQNKEEPPPMPARPSVDGKRDAPSRSSIDIRRETPSRNGTISRTAASDDEESDLVAERQASLLTDFPDSSQANRRPPRFREQPHEIMTGYDTKLFALCGEVVCTTGYLTRVWNIITGQQLMSLSHGETTKATAVAFKPGKAVEDEGKRLWLGMNTGELHEIDIPTQSIIATKSNSSARFPVVKIVRHGTDMWTIDEEGKWLIWPCTEDGSPSLSNSPKMSRIPAGASFSIVVGSQLWVAHGKEIRVYEHNPSTRTATQTLQKPLCQVGVGEVTSGATISSQADRVYFGHADGKVTIYSRKDYSCLGVVNVSLYKISSLAGVGNLLWACFNTGMIYVYDTTTQPWKVKKDWKAHHNTIAGVIVDRTSIWKLDRLQVASLGTDQLVQLWDGMLTDDWLEIDMQEHDADFCDFREVSTLVMTWNAGASKPTALRHDEKDSNFFRELLTYSKPADIIVFGFQELVDLEDKKVTARNIFKSSKKKDDSHHEHMAHQYRAWRDFLSRAVVEIMGPTTSYTLLHTTELVGLFTCIFIKSSERSKIRDVNAAEVKLGMGGIYGNKGALVVRLILDDSSICFINCHLAAGQRQTAHRNNDIAAIMETQALPAQRDTSTRSDTFVGGGDGSMILDHEICILNGDLNYRIDTIPRDTVIAAINKGDLQKLLERDQLLLSRKRNPGFRLRAFYENPIMFPPTYKYDVGTDTYDSSEKKRSPAWCDRLLYRGKGRIKQIEYRRHEVRVSDHRPVSGVFKLRVKTIDPKRQALAREACEKRFDDVKARIAMDIKLDYLVNVFGLSQREAERLLKA